MQQRLTDMGARLKVNGEAIYGTRNWEKAPAITKQTTNFFTKKGNDLYLIVNQWPDKPIEINGIKKAGLISMLGYSGKVKYTLSSNSVAITFPEVNPANNPCQYAWVIKIKDVFK